jgi:hypothetical protein
MFHSAHIERPPSLGWVRAFVNRFNLRVEVLSRILQCEARRHQTRSAQPKVRASSAYAFTPRIAALAVAIMRSFIRLSFRSVSCYNSRN